MSLLIDIAARERYRAVYKRNYKIRSTGWMMSDYKSDACVTSPVIDLPMNGFEGGVFDFFTSTKVFLTALLALED